MTLVSVIMAARNSEKYIGQAIESVLLQTYKKFEFIIIDDASTDSTYKIIKEYKKSDKRIRIHRNKKKKGPAQSRNIAIDLSKGKWISVIDSDDSFFPRKIEKQINLAKKENNIIFIGTSLLFTDNSGRHVAYYKYKNKSNLIKNNILKNKNFPPHSSYFINKNYLKKINSYNARYLMAPDYDLLLRLQMFKEKKFAVCEEVLTKVRIHDQNRSLKKINNFSQLDFAILANINFQIVKIFNIDPAKKLSNKDWEKFMRVLKLFISKLNYYKFLVNKLKYKKQKKISEYIKYFLNNYFIKSFFIGHVLPQKYQNEFIKIYKAKFDLDNKKLNNKF